MIQTAYHTATGVPIPSSSPSTSSPSSMPRHPPGPASLSENSPGAKTFSTADQEAGLLLVLDLHTWPQRTFSALYDEDWVLGLDDSYLYFHGPLSILGPCSNACIPQDLRLNCRYCHWRSSRRRCTRRGSASRSWPTSAPPRVRSPPSPRSLSMPVAPSSPRPMSEV